METFELLDMVSGGGPGTERGYYRIRTSSSTVKYLVYDCPNPSFPDHRGDKLAFQTVPAGNWNCGHLVPSLSADMLMLGPTETVALAAIDHAWHPATIDEADLGEVSAGSTELQGRHQAHSVLCGEHFRTGRTFASFEWCPDEMYGVQRETDIYARIQGHGIGPAFLAHLTENRTRIIGFLVEHVPGRPATLADLAACRDALTRLHGRGIAYGRLSPSSFILDHGHDHGGALLHSFAGAYETTDPRTLEAEMASLEEALRMVEPAPVSLSAELNDALHDICRRDGGIHPAVLHRAATEGRADIGHDEHVELLLQLQRDRGLWKVE